MPIEGTAACVCVCEGTTAWKNAAESIMATRPTSQPRLDTANGTR